MSNFAIPTSEKSSQGLPKVTIVYDNRKTDDRLTEGFGFSCVVEWKHRKILFDTGGDGAAFFSNMGKLGIDLNTITHVVFSHKHWDHTAAFKDVLAGLNKSAVLYLPEEFDLSLESMVPKHILTHRVKDFEEIDQDINSLVLRGSYWAVTTIQEQSLVLKTEKGLVILTGCAHPGIECIAKVAKEKTGENIHLIIGGFHLHRSWKTTCEKVVQAVRQLGVEKVAPCHCAGELAIKIFSDSYGPDFIKTGTGTVINI